MNHQESSRVGSLARYWPVDISAGFEGGTKVIGTVFGISKRVYYAYSRSSRHEKRRDHACAKSHVIPTRDFGIIIIIIIGETSTRARLAAVTLA